MKDPRLEATVCGRCFVEASADRGGWALALGELTPLPKPALESAAGDPDWAVRWGACRALAKARKVDVAREIADRVGDGQGEAALAACATAARGAASRKLSVADFFAFAGRPGKAAAARCAKRQEEVRQGLELELYANDRGLQAEALAHLALFLGVPAAKAALMAMASRPPPGDPIIAGALVDAAERGGLPAGLALVRAAGPGDEPLVNRLLAVYSARIDELRPKLSAAEPPVRREAIAALSNLGPLAARELEGMLADGEVTVRVAAARALARGEGRSLAEAVKEKLASSGNVATQVRWIEFVGRAAESGCAPVLGAAAENIALDDEVRGAAYAALGPCDGARAFAQVKPALSAKSAKVRAGAVQALGSMPRLREAEAASAAALDDESPEVLAAAVRTVAAQRQRGRSKQLVALCAHDAPAVRLATAEALGLLGDPAAAKGLSERLAGDPSVEVRVAAARSLGIVGGPFALSALTAAARGDADGRVRFIANDSLRRLGFQR